MHRRSILSFKAPYRDLRSCYVFRVILEQTFLGEVRSPKSKGLTSLVQLRPQL